MDNVSVLLVSPFDSDQRAMASIFCSSRWSLAAARDLQQAREILRRDPPAIIVTEASFPGGDWRLILDVAADLTPVSPRVIVTSRLADDELWQLVLDNGGYDVLEKPFDRQSTFWTIGQAWRHWRSDLARSMQSLLDQDQPAAAAGVAA
jgi:DNA-binding NtrC family response regulator